MKDKRSKRSSKDCSGPKNGPDHGDYVILHVHIMNAVEAPNLAVMDIFRVENGKLMEHWDVASPVPETAKNVNGVF